MSRSGYTDDFDDEYAEWARIRWRGAVKSAIRGERGQKFFRDLVAALDALPSKRLITNDLQRDDGSVCAIGAVGLLRGIDMEPLDPENSEAVSATFDIADALAREVVHENDECGWPRNETPEQRYRRMRQWAESMIRPAPPKDGGA